VNRTLGNSVISLAYGAARAVAVTVTVLLVRHDYKRGANLGEFRRPVDALTGQYISDG